MTTRQKSTKPKARRVRGTGTYVGDEFTFKPCAEGESTQRDVKSCKNGKLFTTTSEKKPLQVAHLSCPADSPDPWAEYTRRLIQLGVKPLQPAELPVSQRVVSEDGLECWLNEEDAVLTFTGTIDLTRHCRDWQAEVLRQVQLVVRRLPASERFNKTINNAKKGELK